jgi:hypothetical protein
MTLSGRLPGGAFAHVALSLLDKRPYNLTGFISLWVPLDAKHEAPPADRPSPRIH